MSSPNASLRQRPGKDKSKVVINGDRHEDGPANTYEPLKRSALREWDYKIGLTIVTILAFVTRFFGISHPNEVVFDEVHFGKVWEQLTTLLWVHG